MSAIEKFEQSYQQALSAAKNKRHICLLHGTSTLHLPKIFSEGLKRPYLTDDRKVANYFAELSVYWLETGAGGNGGTPVILRVEADTRKLESDAAMFDEPIDAVLEKNGMESRDEWYEKIDSKPRQPPFTGPWDWRMSLRVVSSVVSTETISASRIDKKCLSVK